MAAHPTIHGIRELATATGLHWNTIYSWFKKPDDPLVKVPSPEKALAVCRALSIPLRDFWDAYEGREPEPSSAEAEGAVAAGVLRALEEQDDEPPPRLPPGTDG